ncbi:hypothetical protein BDV39DRAFT_206088 [Aspergillus sergii]|uniref:Uncharacterized protein n=1 Tax=Aspergillus sergii TaxID=1034303 RepID=A0A5N6WZL9_9EURO|nr:hypothetical protein BDV39DRAFT_206088 [Aspergillus sergii]
MDSDPFGRLPWFVLQRILSDLPGLPALYSLYKASPGVAGFLHQNNDLFARIVDSIIDNPVREKGLAPHVQDTIRLIILVWTPTQESETDILGILHYVRERPSDWPSMLKAISLLTRSAILCRLLRLIVGSASASEGVNAKLETNLFKQKCISGTGANSFAGLCEFGCKYGYCPLGACYCQLQGEPREAPNATGPMGYPQAGLDVSYSGLCAFDCPHGFCLDTVCNTVSAPLSTPTVSPFLPPACIGGTGEGNLAGLCDFACNLGFCPINACTCTAQGALHTLPEATDKVGEAGPGMDETVYGPLCAFTCKYGYCPEGACAVSTSGGEGDGKGSGEVYVDPGIFLKPSPVVGCIPPCTLIMPDLLLNNPTTIYLSPVATSITLGTTTIKTVYPSPSMVMPCAPMSLPWPIANYSASSYHHGYEIFQYVCRLRSNETLLLLSDSQLFSGARHIGGRRYFHHTLPTSSLCPVNNTRRWSYADTNVSWNNRFLPTTTFTSHASFPTCTDINSPGCGHRCTSNCGSSSSDECTAQTATNYWVTCSDTSCSTTKTATFTGCSVTNSATTTGKYCPTGVKIDPYDDQGANGYAPRTTSTITTSIPEITVIGGKPYTVTRGTINVDGTTIQVPNMGGNEQVSTTIDDVPMVIIPSYSGTVAVPVFPTAKPTSISGSHSTTSSATTSTTTKTTSSAKPAPTSADGCDLMKKQGVCWNKCDPITGKAVGGGWEKGDPWCWLEHGGVGAFCNHQTDCPTTFQCQPSSWAQGGCTIPEPDSGGCAIMDGIQGVCWSKCNPKTSQPVKEEWKAGDPWCWLKTDQAGAFCSNDKDCPADLECQPSSWAKGGCSASTPIAAQLLSFHTNGTSAGPLGLGPGLY